MESLDKEIKVGDVVEIRYQRAFSLVVNLYIIEQISDGHYKVSNIYSLIRSQYGDQLAIHDRHDESRISMTSKLLFRETEWRKVNTLPKWHD